MHSSTTMHCFCVCVICHFTPYMQALAKIAVRSGEPFRVQCYQILAAAAGGSVAHRNRSSSRGGNALAPAAAAGKVAVAAKAAAASAAAESAAGDPLGVAAVVGPALEVLDHMYASKYPCVLGRLGRFVTPAFACCVSGSYQTTHRATKRLHKAVCASESIQ